MISVLNYFLKDLIVGIKRVLFEQFGGSHFEIFIILVDTHFSLLGSFNMEFSHLIFISFRTVNIDLFQILSMFIFPNF